MVIKKKGSNNWEYCVYIGQDDTGKKKYKRKCGFKTKKSCVEEACMFENKKLKSKENIKTFTEVGLMFLEDCKVRGLKKTSIDNYYDIFKMLTKYFEHANYLINSITIENIYSFMYSKYVNQLSNCYKKSMLFILKSIFIFAEKHKLISNNICQDIEFTKVKNTSIRNIWSESELKQYLPILKNFKYFDIVFLALETGLRRGELLALTWDCVNFKKNTLMITKSYIKSSNFLGFSTPKTKSSNREIDLLDNSMALLKKRHMEKTSKYIFPNRQNKNIPVHPNTLTKEFKKFLVKNNIRTIHFHDLRHIHATLLLNKNVNYKLLSKRLGHNNIAFTLQTYTHIMQDSELQIFKSIGNLF